MGEANVVVLEEALEPCAMRPFDLGKSWPALDEIAKQRGITLLKPSHSLRVILLKSTAHAVREPYLVCDQLAALFHQMDQGAHWYALRPQRRELVRMTDQQIQSE